MGVGNVLRTLRAVGRWFTQTVQAVGEAFGDGVREGLAEHRRRSATGNSDGVRRALVLTPVAVLGHIAKADGRVSEAEAKYVRGYMVFVLAGLRGNRSDLADLRRAFEHGKSKGFDLQHAVAEFRDVVTQRLDRSELENLFRNALGMAWADGSVHPAQRGILDKMALTLGLSPGGVSVIEEMAATDAHGELSAAQKLAAARMLLGLGSFSTEEEVHSAYSERAADLQRLTAQGFPQKINEEIVEALGALHEAYVLILSTK